MELRKYERLARWIKPEGSLRLPYVLIALQKRGIKLRDLEQAVFAPRPLPSQTRKSVQGARRAQILTPLGLRRDFIIPFLRALRGTQTLAVTAQRLGTHGPTAYNHWETGRRDIPLTQFLMVIADLSGRLPAFLETLGISNPPPGGDFSELHLGRYREFFSDPWTPTVLMSLRLPQVLSMPSGQAQARYLSEVLQIPQASIENSMDLLLRLQLARLQGGRFVGNPVQFDAIPSIEEKKIQEIHQFWFQRASSMLARPGFHKLEQHALTHESKEKIIFWISELREKIHQEVIASGSPETLIHIHWQLAEIIS